MFRRRTRSAGLEQSLTRYLELRLPQLERESQEEAARHKREEARSEVGRIVTWLLLLAGYALILGAVNSNVLVGSITNPTELADRTTAALEVIRQVTAYLPDPLRGLMLSAFSTVVLLVLRTASFSARADLGGALYFGVTVLALLALSAAASAGAIGALAALPGVLAVGFVMYEFSAMLRRLRRSEPDDAGGAAAIPGAGPRRRLQRTLTNLLSAIAPARGRSVAVLFVGLPLLCLAMAEASDATGGGWLYWPTRFAYVAFALWCLWAFAVTPAEVRIPLWSIVVWAAVFLTQLGFSPVTQLFAPLVIALLLINVVLLTLRLGRR